MLAERDNFLQTVGMTGSPWIPALIYISPELWHKHREQLEAVLLAHPQQFPAYRRGLVRLDKVGHRTGEWTDGWSVRWRNVNPGIIAMPVPPAPLGDWRRLQEYKLPDSRVIYSERRKKFVKELKCRGYVAYGGGVCGIYQRLVYLRGFENLMIDFADEPAELDILIERLVEYHLRQIEQYLDLGVDVLYGIEELSGQGRMSISPEVFRRFLKPAYEKLFKPARERGGHVHVHVAGRNVEIIDDLIESGISILCLQENANGLDTIAAKCRGKVCIDIDFDRNQVLPRGTAKDIERRVEECIHIIRGKSEQERQGLLFSVGFYGDVPLRNIKALLHAFDKHNVRTLSYTPYSSSYGIPGDVGSVSLAHLETT